MSSRVVKNYEDKLLTVCVFFFFVTVRYNCIWHDYDGGLQSVFNFHHILFKKSYKTI